MQQQSPICFFFFFWKKKVQKKKVDQDSDLKLLSSFLYFIFVHSRKKKYKTMPSYVKNESADGK
jgi:hypothetical protein